VTRLRVVVVDHHDSYTWNLVHLLAAVTGDLPVVVEHDEADVDEVLAFTHVVLSPGPGHPADPRDFGVGREVVRRVADGAQVAVLGVCLGLQGIVTTLGGAVERVRPAHGEVAVVEHDGAGVLTGLPSPFHAVRYHSLAAVRVPDDLVVTATDAEGTVMGVRHRTRPLEGVQFHPESVLSEHGPRLVANFLAARDG
jgi:anthranilate synthase/aminodeoxychorismate synthase-like glutamine amidotransferase